VGLGVRRRQGEQRNPGKQHKTFEVHTEVVSLGADCGTSVLFVGVSRGKLYYPRCRGFSTPIRRAVAPARPSGYAGGSHRLPERPAGAFMSRPDSSDAPGKEARKSVDVAVTASKILANIEKVILGKRQQITLALVAYFCEGHVLLEDVPG